MTFSSLNALQQLRRLVLMANNLKVLKLEDMPELHEISIQWSGIESVEFSNLPKLFNI